MHLPRRTFIGLIPLSALSLQVASQAKADEATTSSESPLITSPPVVQHPSADGFTVHIAVSRLATGWVEWGTSADRLDRTAVAAHHGLVQASDRALAIRVHFEEPLPAGQPIYYRVVVQPLAYKNAYTLERGEPTSTPTYTLRLPNPAAERVTIAFVNDTHENRETIAALHERVAALAPDLLIWNGDTCNDFDLQDDPMQIVLNPARDVSKAWAAERPLLFVPGNHDVRGARARELTSGLSGWPGQSDLPYNFALRFGPIGMVGLDTGEDKPDAHPVFAGTAAYEPYRKQQATWLKSAVQRPEIASAPIRLAICHIPLRGLPGHNDGTTLEGFAYYSGMGQQLWLPTLIDAKFHAVISAHMHQHRIDEPDDKHSIVQVVGGGPQPRSATLMIVTAEGNKAELRVEDLSGKVINRREWTATA